MGFYVSEQLSDDDCILYAKLGLDPIEQLRDGSPTVKLVATGKFVHRT